MTLSQFLKALHSYWCQCHWTVVTQTADDGLFGGGTIKEDFRQSRTVDWYKNWLEILMKTPASWSAQSLNTCPETPSGPAAFLGFTGLKVGLTSTMSMWPAVVHINAEFLVLSCRCAVRPASSIAMSGMSELSLVSVNNGIQLSLTIFAHCNLQLQLILLSGEGPGIGEKYARRWLFVWLLA